jgi:bifunctional non-homologous end joining protein LigD
VQEERDLSDLGLCRKAWRQASQDRFTLRWQAGRGRLVYADKVRTGYTEATARELRERLDPLIRKQSPLSIPVKKAKATWVEPEVSAEVECGALTDDGLLQEAVFKGVRDDLQMPKVKAPRRLAPSAVGRPRGGVPRENILQLPPNAVVPAKHELASRRCEAPTMSAI